MFGFAQVHARLLCVSRGMLYNRRTREQPERPMNKIAIAFLATVSLASFGCKKKGGGEALEAMKKFKTELCACKDHDLDCAKKAQEAFAKAQTPAEGAKAADTAAKPDPEIDKLNTEIQECSKRVMSPDVGAAGGAAGTPPAGGAAPAGGSDQAAAPAAGGAAPAAG